MNDGILQYATKKKRSAPEVHSRGGVLKHAAGAVEPSRGILEHAVARPRGAPKRGGSRSRGILKYAVAGSSQGGADTDGESADADGESADTDDESALAAPATCGSCGKYDGGAGSRRHRRGGQGSTAPLSGAAEAALAGVTTNTSECAEDPNRKEGTPCAPKHIVRIMADFVKAAPPEAPPAPATGELLPSAADEASEVVREAAGALQCSSESCVLLHPTFQQFVVKKGVPKAVLDSEIRRALKPAGPRNSLGLLSNFNIDDTLRQWARVFPEFYPCPFAMMDFDTNGDEFGSADIAGIVAGYAPAARGTPRECFGCVVNTDTSRGPGKHWVAAFVDCRAGPGEPWTVEYFNSAGHPPPKPMVGWMERTRARLAEYRATRPECRRAVCDVVSVPVTDVDHQKSQTECGLYALFYIRRRLEGTPYEFFESQLVPDDAMTAFRRHVFRAH